MAVIRDRPLSEAQTQALSALSQYGYIAEPTGSPPSQFSVQPLTQTLTGKRHPDPQEAP